MAHALSPTTVPIAPALDGRPSATVSAAPSRPALAGEVFLLGEMLDTGFENSMWLVQVEGRFLQLTELLFRVAEHCDGTKTYADIAQAVSDSTEWAVSAEDVEYLVVNKLQPTGILRAQDTSGDGTPRAYRSAPSLLRLGLRTSAIGAGPIETVCSRLQVLFTPALLIPLLLAGVLTHAWLYLDHGVDGLFSTALNTPGMLLALFLISVLPGFWHEFGHASALRYGGGRARSIGVGIYVMDPAFYTDVTDSYRLGRAGRIRTGLGGVYFDMLLSLVFMAAYFVTGAEMLLVLVVMLNINTAYQFIPIIRLDGYWVLADLTGVPDFFSMMGAFVRSVVPIPAWKGTKLPPLKPWVQLVFAAYTLIAFPAMIFFMVYLLRKVPTIFSLVWDASLVQVDGIQASWTNGEWINVAAYGSQLFLLAVTMIGLAYFLYMLARTAATLLLRLARTLMLRWRPAALPGRA